MQKIVKSNLVNEVYSQLLNMLASGEYPEGSKLPSETQLSEQLGVSRNTIRTAMSKLIALGLVENQQGYGNCVRNMNMGVCKRDFADYVGECARFGSHDRVPNRCGEHGGTSCSRTFDRRRNKIAA